MNPKAPPGSDDSLSPTEDGVNDGPGSSSSSSSNRSNRNHEVDNDDDDENEVFAGEVDVFGPSSLGEASVFSTSLVVSPSSSVAAKTRELKKLNVNVII